MARKKKSKTNPDRNRAARIRAKIKGGDNGTVEELEFLRAYELTKKPPGRPPKKDEGNDSQTTQTDPAETADAESEESDEEGDSDADDGDAGDDAATAAQRSDTAPAEGGAAPASDPLPRIDVPPPPRPPRVKIGAPPRTSTRAPDDEPKAGGKGDWRAKYREGFGGVGGREATVTEVAKIYRGVLESLCEGIRSAGVEPKVDPAALYPSIVLVIDELMPAHVELTPKMVVVGGTSVLLVQRFMNRKEIADVEKRKRDADAMRARNDERKQRVSADPVPPSAAPADATEAAPHVNASPAEGSGVDTADHGRRDPFDPSGFAPVNGIPKVTSEELIARDPSVVI